MKLPEVTMMPNPLCESSREGSGALTDDQLEGLACVRCGRQLDEPSSPPSVPIGTGARGQVFACSPSCDAAELATDAVG